ncbi:sulfite exporter TauE/SafE family protein [Magnetococcales bacterium HHB-1]
MVDSISVSTSPTLVSVWLMGLSVGLTSCAATCLPFIGTWTLGRGRGGWSALMDTGFFLLGKVLAYTLLGASAGFLGAWLTTDGFGEVGHIAIGLSSIMAGLWLVYPKQGTSSLCAFMTQKMRFPPIVLGFSISLVPCAPLASLLALSALNGAVWQGAQYGALFGLGTTLTPLIFIIPVMGFMSRHLLTERPWLISGLRVGAAIVLCLLGLHRLISGV